MISQDIIIKIGTTPKILKLWAKAQGESYDLTGGSVVAKVRDSSRNEILDLNPQIDGVLGLITIAPTDEATAGLKAASGLSWDCIVTLADDVVLEPIIGGRCEIQSTVSL